MSVTAIACAVCGTPLTGGRDTYGPGDAPRCFLHVGGLLPGEDAPVNDRKTFLTARLGRLKQWHEESEEEYEHLRKDIGRYEQRIYDAERELEGGKRCEEEVDDE